jgi:hypothetical protein
MKEGMTHMIKRDSTLRPRILIRLGLLAIAVAIIAAFPAPALATPPPNDDFADAQDLGSAPGASVSGTNRYATAEFGEPNHHGYPALASVWYRWTAPTNGVVRLNTCGSNFDTLLAVYRGLTVDRLGRVASSDDFCGSQSSLKFGTVAGTTYRIAVDGYAGQQGSIALELAPAVPPSNDAFADALDLGSGLSATASGTNLDATAELGEPAHYPDVPAAASVWYRWTSPADRSVQIDTCGSDFDTVLAVYRGSALDALDGVASDDESCRRYRSRVEFDAEAGEIYRIAVDGYRGAEGSIELALGLSNQFRFGKIQRDEERGTAELAVSVPNPGDLKLARTGQVKGADASAEAAGHVTLAIIPRGAARATLNDDGRVTVKAKLTYTPEGGEPTTKAKRITLIKRT